MTNLQKPDPSKPNQLPSRWIHARHVDYLDEILVNLVAGVYRDQGYVGVIIMEPPRHGKSELCSHYFPAWYLGAKPDNRVILVSYEATFAAEWGRKVRDTIAEYGSTFFGIDVSKSSAAADRWNLARRKGGMITAGSRGSITGRGGDLIIVDDPVKNKEEASSETIRDKIWETWTSTIRTRLEPGGVILVIGTRWHEDDLIGRLLREMEENPEADRWLVVNLPAIAEDPRDFDNELGEEYIPDALGRKPGEVLFPERWPMTAFVPLMQNEYDWAALYQQRPAPLEGGLFKRDWLPLVPLPSGKFKRRIRYWDMAATEVKDSNDPDYTVGLLLGEHEDGSYYVLDVQRLRTEQPEKFMKQVTAREQGYIRFRVEQEPGSQGKLYVRGLARSVFRGKAFRGVRNTGPKPLRVEIVANACERGEIRVVRAPWNRDFVKECMKYPNATHDDQVDAFAGAYQEMTSRGSGMVSF